jgi:hypothetical protein
MFYRWRQLDEDSRQHVWRLYGWYSALMLCGSCVGVVTWAAWMQVIVNEFRSVRDRTLAPSQSNLFYSLSFSWNVVFRVSYAIEFLCLSVAKLMVLDRLSHFATRHWIWEHWVIGRHVVMACVVAGNLVGLAGNIAAAVPYDRVARLTMAASHDLAANENSAAGFQKIKEASDPLQLALYISSVQAFCEVAVLLLIVVAFAVVGALCLRRVSAGLIQLEAAGPKTGAAMDEARQLRRQIVSTTGVVFVTFVLRCIYSIMYAVSSKLQNIDNRCAGIISFCDVSCFNVFTHVSVWMQFTPEFQLMVVLLSKPLPLLVALWGMTSQRMRREFQVNQVEMTTTKDRVLKNLNLTWAFGRSTARS